MVLGYFLVFKILVFQFIDWILTVFTLLTAIAPVVMLSVLGDETKLQTLSARGGAVAGILIGVTVGLIWSYYTKGDLDLQPLNAVFAILISGVTAYLGYAFSFGKA